MPSLDEVIEQFVVGDDLNVRATVTNVPNGDPLTKAWFTVKKREADEDADAVFQKVITTSSGASGQITDAGASGTGTALFVLGKSDTVLLTGERTYYFDVQVKTSTGLIYTPIKGQMVGEKQVTRADS